MYQLRRQDQSILTSNSSILKEGNFVKVRELEQILVSGLAKLNIEDVTLLQENIRQTEERINEYEKEAEKEMEYLRECKDLQGLVENICHLKHVSCLSKNDNDLNQKWTAEKYSGYCGIKTLNEEKKRMDIKNFYGDLAIMPSCTEKTIVELLEHFEQRLLGDFISCKEESLVRRKLFELQDQIKRQELFSEEIQVYLQDLNKAVHRNDCLSIVNVLNKLLKRIRPLNVQEIQRLREKTKKAAALIRDKEIILLVGATEVGKVNTIQYLAGEKMEERRLKFDDPQCLEPLTTMESVKNSGSTIVTSHSLRKFETRHIAPITIQLKEIFGHYETGEIILCNAPDFSNSEIPEVDIVNGVAVIEALKECRSIKILALSSYDSLVDRERGILKLIRTLIDMVDGIEHRLDSICYGFTKCPVMTDINALLVDFKSSIMDAFSESDSVLMTVLLDMIEKTVNGAALKIDPIDGDPKELIKKFKHIHGIAYPGEVFRFSISKETELTITNQIERDKSNIRCALKHRNNDLLMYYLNNLKILKDLIKQSFIQDAYEDSIRFVRTSINEFGTEVMKNFNDALVSKDGLRKEDIRDYKNSFEYIQKIQILKDHLGSHLISHEIFIQNIEFELKKISQTLLQEDLHSPLVGIYFDNLYMLKNSFEEFELHYSKSCEDFAERLKKLTHAAREPILANEFRYIAEILHTVLQCSLVLKKHLDERIKENYDDIVKLLLKHLSSFSEKAEFLLAKIRLNDNDVTVLKNYMEILRAARENAALQEHISTYAKMQKKKLDVSSQQTTSYVYEKNCTYFNEIYNQFISKFVKYFDEINERIREIFERNGSHSLEYIEKFILDMEAIRTIPEFQFKTAQSYYRIVENISGYIKRLQRETEELLFAIDHHSRVPNYRNLARSLTRLKKAEWINRVSPSVSDNLMSDITDELVHRAHQLEVRLMNLNLSFNYPDHICVAQEILEKIQSMSILERSVPELERYRVNIFQRFLQSTQTVFDHIKKTFNLQNRTVSHIKEELNELEEIKREYENLHPARMYLRKQGYLNIDVLNHEIEDLKSQKNVEIMAVETETCEEKNRQSKLNLVLQKYADLISFKADQSSMIEKVVHRTRATLQNNTEANDYLRKEGYSTINAVYNAREEFEKAHIARVQLIGAKFAELSSFLIHLESIRGEYNSLLASHDSVSSTEVNFLREKGQESSIELDKTIQEKKKIFDECLKNKQTYYFDDRLDASAANNALVYIEQCEKVDHVRVKENAADAHEILKTYISEYGNFLHQKIRCKFNHTITCIDVQEDLFQYTHDLKMYLQELSSLSKFTYVFKCINGVEKVEYWHQEFLDYYHNLSYKLEEYKIFDQNKDLKNQLIIAQVLSCLDRFCEIIFSDHGFRTLYGKYRVEITKECRAVYELVLSYISKGDYGNADILLHDMDENHFTPRDLAQIKYNLESSLQKLMKETKSIAIWLDRTIESEQSSRTQIRELKENVEKIRTAFNKHNLMVLLDNETRTILSSFDNDMNEILSEIILRGLRSIEICIDADSFCQAEKIMDNLSCAQRELADICTSDSVYKKSEELRKKFDNIVSTISSRYDSLDVEDYSFHSPKDLLKKLELVESRGGTRYHQIRMTVLRKVRQNFSLAIEKLLDTSLDERPAKIRSLNCALCFLPEELQTSFKLQLDEFSQLFTDEEKMRRVNLKTYSKTGTTTYPSS